MDRWMWRHREGMQDNRMMGFHWNRIGSWNRQWFPWENGSWEMQRPEVFQGWSFWAWAIIQYILFISMLFLLYRTINVSIYQIIVFIAIALWIIRIIIFYINKKAILKIPILSEIVSIVLH
jgi:hypothetical protein